METMSKNPLETENGTFVKNTNRPATATVLYVEDDVDAQRLLELACIEARVQFQLRFACTVEGAVEYLARGSSFDDALTFRAADFVLLDYSIGLATGIKVLTWMRRHPHWRSTEVAVFSASDASEQIAEAYGAGANYYLMKPHGYARLTELAAQINRGFHANSRHGMHRLVTLEEYRPRLCRDAVRGDKRAARRQSASLV